MATKRLALAATFALLMGIAALATTASAWQNCTTNCSGYGGQTTCTRSCF